MKAPTAPAVAELTDFDPRDARTVLVCDDEEVLRSLVRAAFSGRAYTVVEAAHGDECLDACRRSRPDVILLDMMMPARSGLEVLGEIRSDPELRETPVVMLTARTQTADRAAAFDGKADRFLAKPFSPRELVSLVDELVAPR